MKKEPLGSGNDYKHYVKDCSDSLEALAFANIEMEYVSTSGFSMPIITSYQDIFYHSRKYSCPVESC